MTTETLSDKIIEVEEHIYKEEWRHHKAIPTKDVREFIKLEGEALTDLFNKKITWDEFMQRRRALVGKELVE